MSAASTDIVVNAPNRWRLETPGHAGWPRTARPGSAEQVPDDLRRLPRQRAGDAVGRAHRARSTATACPASRPTPTACSGAICEGYRPDRLRLSELEGEDQARAKAGADPQDRLRDHARRRHRRRGDLPEQGPRDVGDARSGLRAGAVPRVERLGVGDVRAVRRSPVARRPRSPPAISRARSRKCSGSRSSASGSSRCRASRSGAVTTSST